MTSTHVSADLKHFMYASNSVRDFSEADLWEMLCLFRHNNEEHDLTGMLLYGNGKFVQLVEGPDASVDSLIEQIRKDGRHADIQTLSEGPILERLFPDWSMGYKRLTTPVAAMAHSSESLPAYRDITEASSHLPSRELLTLFSQLAS